MKWSLAPWNHVPAPQNGGSQRRGAADSQLRGAPQNGGSQPGVAPTAVGLGRIVILCSYSFAL